MTPFRLTPGGYAAKWELPEIEAFASLAGEVAELLRGANTARPTIPRAATSSGTVVATTAQSGAASPPRSKSGQASGQMATSQGPASDIPDSEKTKALDDDELAVLAALDFAVDMQKYSTRRSISGGFGKRSETADPETRRWSERSGYGRPFDNPFSEGAEQPAHPTARNPEPYPNPVLDRLLPAASKLDPALAADFQQLAGADIATTKADALDQFAALVRQGLKQDGRIVIPREDAPQVAAALTDLRLTLAVQLDIKDEHDTDRLESEALSWAKQAARHRKMPVATDYQFLVSLYLVAGATLESLLALMVAEL